MNLSAVLLMVETGGLPERKFKQPSFLSPYEITCSTLMSEVFSAPRDLNRARSH